MTDKKTASAPLSADIQTQLRGWMKELVGVRRASNHSVTAYLHDISGFLAFLHQHLGHAIALDDLAKLEERDLRAWLSYRVGKGYAK